MLFDPTLAGILVVVCLNDRCYNRCPSERKVLKVKDEHEPLLRERSSLLYAIQISRGLFFVQSMDLKASDALVHEELYKPLDMSKTLSKISYATAKRK